MTTTTRGVIGAVMRQRQEGGSAASLTRRQFGVCLGTFAGVTPSLAARSFITSSLRQSKMQASIVGVTRRRAPAFSFPTTSVPSGQTWRYGLAIPFQVAPRRGAVFCNMALVYPPGGDWEVGTDVIVFDDPASFRPIEVVPVSRVHNEPNPHSRPAGKPASILKGPVRGGFVPYGAKRPDGSPHPHAGTGFGLLLAFAVPIYRREQIEAASDNLEPYVGEEAFQYLELQQYAYDGKHFRVVRSERIGGSGRGDAGSSVPSDLLPGWQISAWSITNAIPDGDDLLLAATAEKPGTGRGAGVTRWKRIENAWRAVSFSPVTGEDRSVEPSLVRDTDGSLLFSARPGRDEDRGSLRVWRGHDLESQWRQVINARGVVTGPISINQAADGTPYVVSSLYQVALFPLAPRWKIIVGHHMVPHGGWMRETLCLWPLNAKRNGLEAPIVARDSRGEFGPPPDSSYWLVDHAAAMTLQLADGEWRNILGYRVGSRGEMSKYGSDPTPFTGAYLEEVQSSGARIPVWTF